MSSSSLEASLELFEEEAKVSEVFGLAADRITLWALIVPIQYTGAGKSGLIHEIFQLAKVPYISFPR